MTSIAAKRAQRIQDAARQEAEALDAEAPRARPAGPKPPRAFARSREVEIIGASTGVTRPARSLAQRVLLRRALEASAAAAGDGLASHTGAAASAYDVMRAKLYEDMRSLKSVQSLERKIALKRELLPGYFEWVRGVLEGAAASGAGVDDEVLATVLVWLIDVGELASAVPLAEYVLRHGLRIPRHDRQAAVIITEEVAETALKMIDADQPVPMGALTDIWLLTEAADMPDQVRAKLEKAMGLELARQADATEPGSDGIAGAGRALREEALKHLRRAVELDDAAGVKGRIKALEKALEKTGDKPA